MSTFPLLAGVSISQEGTNTNHLTKVGLAPSQVAFKGGKNEALPSGPLRLLKSGMPK